MHNINCIKCGKPYQDKDPEPYYCAVCLEEKKRMAAEIDKRIQLRGSSRANKSLLQEYDNAPKVNGFMIVKL
jgi:hypothetical protein